MERLARLPLTFEKGIQEFLDDSVLPQGFAAVIENWVPLPTGGLRAKNGWRSTGTSGPASPDIVGLALQEQLGALIFISYSVAGGSWGVYKITPGITDNAALIGSITAGESPAAMAMGQHTLAFAIATSILLYGVQAGGALVDSGANAVPRNVLALAYHNARFWAGGGADSAGVSHPERLFYQDTGDGVVSAWPTTNWVDIGAGGTIKALREHGDLLIVGKDNGIWLVRGDPADVLDVHRIEGPGDAMLGNSILSTPYGCLICGRTAVYLYDGATLNVISDAIQDSYQGSSARWTDAAYFDQAAYICNDVDDEMWVYDFRTRAWSKELGPTSVKRPQRLTSFTLGGIEHLVGGTKGVTLSTNGVIYRQRVTPPTYTRDFWVNEPAGYRAVSADLWLGPCVLRFLELRLRQRGGNPAETGLIVTATVRQGDGTTKDYRYEVAPRQPGVWRENISLPGPAFGAQFEIAQSLPYGQDSVMDVEEGVLVFGTEMDPR